jgi:cytochrome c oxidase subunit 2
VIRPAWRALALFGLAAHGGGLTSACGGDDAARQTGALVRDAQVAIPDDAQVIQVTASRWAYEPATIMLQQGVPVVLELRSSDVHHGFNVPGLGLRADVLPDRVTRVPVTPQQTGTFLFHCDYYCGSGHEMMEASIIVE